MGSIPKILEKILSGKSDNNISFNDLIRVVNSFGFNCRITGSHHIFTHENLNLLINLQKDKSNKAKSYQVKQIRKIILEFFPNS